MAAAFFLHGHTPAKRTGEPIASRPAAAPRPPLQVSVLTVRTRRFADRIVATGSLRADESVDLKPEMDGRVVGLYFDEGQNVRRGQKLVQLNDAELQASLQRARYELDQAGIEARRAEQLLAIGAVANATYETVMSTLQIRRAELRLIEAQLEKTQVRAPFDGTIGLRAVSIGAYVNSATTLVSLQRIDRLKLDFAVPERYVPYLQVGAGISFRVAGDGEPHPCTVYAYDPRIDAATRTALLRARCPNPGGRLLPGAYATVEMPLAAIDDAIFVPANAVVPGLDEHGVYVLSDGKAHYRVVRAGLRTAAEVQILGGLAAGETIVTSGLQQLRDGQRVEADAAGSAAVPGAGSPRG